jgi:hypothetical protein
MDELKSAISDDMESDDANFLESIGLRGSPLLPLWLASCTPPSSDESSELGVEHATARKPFEDEEPAYPVSVPEPDETPESSPMLSTQPRRAILEARSCFDDLVRF